MLSTIGSFLTSAFVVEYFKEMFLALLLVIYFAVLVFGRPRIVKHH